MSTYLPCDEGVIRAAPAAEAPCGTRSERGRAVLLATILGAGLVYLDGSAVNVALPALQADLGASAAGAQWVVESYALFLAALLLVGGALGDRYGRRLVFGIGLLIFAGASLACGLAPGIGALVAFRALQGIGGALLLPGSLAILSAAFDDEERGKAIGLWSGFTAITAALGPVLGGWLVDNVSWRWVFFLNLPLAALVLAVLVARVPESRDEEARRLDLPGAVLATLGLAGLVFGFIEAGRLGLSEPFVLLSLLLGAAGLVGFLVVEARSSHPMMPLDLFRSRDFSGANLLTLLLYAGLGAALFFLPYQLILVEGYSATAAGAALLPFILIIFALSPWAGGLVTRYGGRRPLVLGPLVAALGFALFAFLPGAVAGEAGVLGGLEPSYWTAVFPAVVVLGLGMGITVAPLTTVVMEAVDRQQSGIASGVSNAVSRTASLLAVAVLGLLMTFGFQRGLEAQLAAPGPGASEAPSVEGLADASTTEAPSWSARPDADAAGIAAWEEAFLQGYDAVMWSSAGLALLAALAAALLIEGKKESGEQGVGETEAEAAMPPA